MAEHDFHIHWMVEEPAGKTDEASWAPLCNCGNFFCFGGRYCHVHGGMEEKSGHTRHVRLFTEEANIGRRVVRRKDGV
jgi:hypothetical protein